MSNAIFPTLPGLQWNSRKTPIFSTLVQTSVSGMETRAAQMAYPRWQWDLSYDVLHSDARAELQSIMGFFLQRQGKFDSFLYDDPEDDSVTGQIIAVGDGVTASFQLVRTFGGFTEPVKALNGAPLVSVGGVLQSIGWSVSPTGLLTFAAGHIPTSDAQISATCSYYWRVRFVEDQYEFQEFMNKLWLLQKINFISVK